MPNRAITLIVIHCSASPDGVALGLNGKTAARVIDGWHKQRGFSRTPSWRLHFNGYLAAIGYHHVIDTDGMRETGRHPDEVGAHAVGHNFNSIGVCMVGTDHFTLAQWDALRQVITQLQAAYPSARVLGHRDLSPDLNSDGVITSSEYVKTCPGFTVSDWLKSSMHAPAEHLVQPA